MPTYEGSLELAKAMVDIGHRAGRNVVALLTGMDEPLGSHVGNKLEVKEAIEILRGECDGPLLTVSLKLGAYLLLAAKVASSPEEGEKMLREALKNGKGLEKLRALIRAQGGDDSVCDHPETLADAPIIMPLCLPESGYIRKMDTTLLGYASQSLGAGRKQKTDGIDPQVGFIMHKRIGDAINEDEALCTIYARDEKTLSEARDMILRAVTVSSAPCDKQQLLYAVVTPEGVTSLSE